MVKFWKYKSKFGKKHSFYGIIIILMNIGSKYVMMELVQHRSPR